jgi:hypothetical protein
MDGASRAFLGAEGRSPHIEQPKLGNKRVAPDSILAPCKILRMIVDDMRSAQSPATLAESIEANGKYNFHETVKTRSGGQCKLTGRAQGMGLSTDAVRIFGLATSDDNRATPFWELLEMFCGSVTVNALQSTISQKINNAANGIYIFMDATSHRLYDDLHFYLDIVEDSYMECGEGAQHTVKLRFPRQPVELYNCRESLSHNTRLVMAISFAPTSKKKKKKL